MALGPFRVLSLHVVINGDSVHCKVSVWSLRDSSASRTLTEGAWAMGWKGRAGLDTCLKLSYRSIIVTTFSKHALISTLQKIKKFVAQLQEQEYPRRAFEWWWRLPRPQSPPRATPRPFLHESSCQGSDAAHLLTHPMHSYS